jgi:hypothetical protein
VLALFHPAAIAEIGSPCLLLEAAGSFRCSFQSCLSARHESIPFQPGEKISSSSLLHSFADTHDQSRDFIHQSRHMGLRSS